MLTKRLNIGVVTISDRCSRGEAVDRSGPAVVDVLKEFFAETKMIDAVSHPDSLSLNESISATLCATSRPYYRVYYRCYTVPDNITAIQQCIKSLTDFLPTAGRVSQSIPQLIITTGGTGLCERDVTPEAIRAILDKEAPGILQMMLHSSLPSCSSAWLSRAVAGVRDHTIIISLPGSPNAARQCLIPLLQTGLLHAVELASKRHPLQAFDVQMTQPFQGDTMTIAEGISRRPRHSPYPLVPMHEAIATVGKVASELTVFPDVMRVPTAEALHFTIATPLISNFPHPPFRASVKDGYAVISSDGPGVYDVAGGTTAGAVAAAKLTSGSVWRVNTGGALPSGADAVVQVEDTELVEVHPNSGAEQRVCIRTAAMPGQDIRPVGIDIAAGATVLAPGTFLTAAEIALATSMGYDELPVMAKPVVAIFSTGDELVDLREVVSNSDPVIPGAGVPPEGKIIDSNKAMLLAALRELRYGEVAAVHDLGVARDTLAATRAKIEEALLAADVIISTGSVSMGDGDHIKPALLSLGATIHFGRVQMKPGKPTTFATWEDRRKVFYGLPGNPVSALVCFHLFVVPFLRRVSGLPQSRCQDPVVQAVVTDDEFELDPERLEYRRGMVTRRSESPRTRQLEDRVLPDVSFQVESCGNQSSSRLLSLSHANGLMVLPPQRGGRVLRGDVVDVVLIGHIY